MPSFKMLKTLELAETRESLAAVVRRRWDKPVILTDKGKPVMVLVPVEAGADVESISLSMSPEFETFLSRSRARFKPGSGVSLEQMKRQFRVRRGAARRAG